MGAAPGRTDAGATAAKVMRLPDWAEFVPQLEPQSGDYLVTKQRWGAFHGTSLDEYLRGRGVTQIALTGVATSVGLESTARSGGASPHR
jgi:nicotinamidase-related amidase